MKGFKCLKQPSLLRGNIDSEIRLNPNLKKTLLDGLPEALEDDNFFYCALLPMNVGTGDSSSSSGSYNSKYGFFTQESFIKVLLGIDSLQPQVISSLLERLPDLQAAATEDVTEGDELLNSRRDASLPRLVLQQLRWMDHIVDPSALTDELLDCATVLNLDLQRDLIMYLPDIVQDTESWKVVTNALEGLLASEESLLAPILDMYTRVNLPVDVLSYIARLMLERLASIEPTALPVLVRFLLETLGSCRDPGLIRDFLIQLRVDITSFPEEPTSRDSAASWRPLNSSLGKDTMPNQDGTMSGNETAITLQLEGEEAERSCCSLTLEELFQGLRMRPCVATAFFKILDEIKHPCDHRPVDVWVLFCLYDTPQYSRKALSVIRKKVTAGQFTYNLLSDTLRCQIGALGPLFPSLLSLADTLVRIGGGKAIRMWGVYLYSLIFTNFQDLYHRQETLGRVLAHAGSGLDPDVGCALHVLESIPPSALKPFAALVKGLLEFMQNFSDVQVRCIFQILCNLMNEDGISSSMDDMHIYIRKNLSLRDMTFKRFGIIGAVSYVMHISCCSNTNRGKSRCERNSEAISMLVLIRIHTKNQPEAAAFAYDELCRLILAPNVSTEVTQWVAQESSAQLERVFLVEMGDDEVCPLADSSRSAFDGAVKLRLTHDLNGQGNNNNSIAVDVMQVLSSGENRTRMKATYLIPVLGLTLVSSIASEGSLVNVDAIIGAPLVLPDQETINAISTVEAPVQEAICWTYYYTLDWCREIINGFVLDTTSQTEISAKIVSRFGTIMELEKILVSLLKQNPNFIRNHMEGLFSGGISTDKREIQLLNNKKKGKTKGRGKVSSPVDSEGMIRNYLHVTMRPLGHRVPCILASKEFRQVVTYVSQSQKDKLSILKLLLGELHRHISSVLAPNHMPSIVGVSSLNTKLLLNNSTSQPPSSPLPHTLQLLQLYLDEHVFSTVGQYFKDIKLYLEVGSSGDDLTQETKDHHNGNRQHLIISSLHIILRLIKLLVSSEELRDSLSGSVLLRSTIGAIALGIEDGGDVFGHLSDELFSITMLVPSLSLSVEVCEVINMVLTVRTMARKQQKQRQLQYADIPPQSEYQYHQRLGKICLSLLGRDWVNSEDVDELSTTKKTQYNAGTLQVLASLYLYNMSTTPLNCCDLSHGDGSSSSSSSYDSCEIEGSRGGFGGLATLENYCSAVLKAGVEGTAEQHGYPSLTKETFAFFYKPAMITLIKVLKDLEPDPKAFNNTNNTSQNNVVNSTSTHAQTFVLDYLRRVVDVFAYLIGFTRLNHCRKVLAIALTEGRRLMTELLKHMSILDETFSKHQETVLKILNSVQPATRQMHILISYAKQSRDKSMTWEAPICRKILERFIFRVKKILQTNNCTEAMFVGNLKARNLDGTLGNPDESPSGSDESQNEQEDAQYGGCTADKNSDTDDSSDVGVEIKIGRSITPPPLELFVSEVDPLV